MTNANRVSCPHCQRAYRIPDSIPHGKRLTCRECKRTFSLSQNHAETRKADAEDDSDVEGGSIFESLDVDQMLASEPQREIRVALNASKKKKKSPASKATNRKPSNKRPGEMDSVAQPDKKPTVASPPPTSSPTPSRSTEVTALQPASHEGDVRNPPQISKTTSTWDDDDLAVFEAVAQQVRRRRRWMILLILIAGAIWGGWFLNQEMERLRQPLSAVDRQILREQGFGVAPEQGELVILAVKDKPERDGVVLSVDPMISMKRLESLANGEVDNNLPAATSLAGKRAKQDARTETSTRDANTRAVLRQQQQDARKAAQIEKQRQQLRDYSNAVALKTDFQIDLEGQNHAAALSRRDHLYFDDATRDASRIRVFDLVASKEITKRTFPGRFGTVKEMAASPDGRYLIVGTANGNVIQYRIDADGSIVRMNVAPPPMNGPVRRLWVDASSRWLVACSDNGNLLRWEMASTTAWDAWSKGPAASEIVTLSVEESSGKISARTGRREWSFLDADSPPAVVTIDVEGVLLATADGPPRMLLGEGQQLRMVDSLSGESIWHRQPDGINHLKFISGAVGQSLIMFRPRNELLLLSAADGEVTARWQLPADARNADGIRVVGQGAGQGACLVLTGQRKKLVGTRLPFDEASAKPALATPVPLPTRLVPPIDLEGAKEGRTLAAFEIDPVEVNDAQLGDDGLLFLATSDGTVVVVDWTRGTIMDELFFKPDERPTALAVEASTLLVGLESGSVQLFQIEPAGKLRPSRSKAFHVGAVSRLRRTNQPGTVAIAFAQGNLKVWNFTGDETTVDAWPLKRAPVQMVVGDDDVTLVTSNEIATVDLEDARVKATPLQGVGSTFAVSPEGTKLAFARGQYVDVGNTRDKRVTGRIDLSESVTGLSFLGDSSSVLIATGGKTGVYRIRTGKEMFTYPARFSNRGDLRVAISDSGRLMFVYQRQWDGNVLVRTVPQ